MEATSVFFAVRPGNDIIPTVGESERCFLCGLLPGYIAGWRPPTVFVLVKESGQYSTAERLQLVSNGKGRHKSWLQQWLQSWIRSLPTKITDSAVVKL
jgi:hypothetical protein